MRRAERSDHDRPCTEITLATQGSQPWACTPVAVLRSAIKLPPHRPRPASMRTVPVPFPVESTEAANPPYGTVRRVNPKSGAGS